MKTPFIFTEAYSCADILKNCLESFYKYHDDPVHVFGTKEDLEFLKKYEKIKPIIIESGSNIDKFYDFGHAGTARIFSETILNYSDTDHIIHFDSDLIFRSKCINEITSKLNEGYDLVGPPRLYKNNPCNRNDIKHLPDVISTCFMGFNRNKITTKNIDELTYQINGIVAWQNTAVLDFFDYISLDILNNGGKIYFFDYDQTGGSNQLGKRDNKYGPLNKEFEYGEWYIHFAGIGSGCRVYKKGYQHSNQSYGNWALKRYALYKKLIEKQTIPNIDIDENLYETYKDLF